MWSFDPKKTLKCLSIRSLSSLGKPHRTKVSSLGKPHRTKVQSSIFSFSISPSVIHKFDQKQCRDALARMIILHEYPFNIVTHEGFIKYSKILQPQFKMVSRNTV